VPAITVPSPGVAAPGDGQEGRAWVDPRKAEVLTAGARPS
jgi:hypothetical protein